jgi:hypothetical protein
MTQHIKLSKYSSVPFQFTGVVECLENEGKRWYVNGELHREDGPAVIYSDGSQEWWVNGFRHRADGPAREYSTGRKEWYLNGKLHREDGPASIEASGTRLWYFEHHYCYSDFDFNQLKGNYIVVERGIPTDRMFGKLKLTHAKFLTGEGTKFVYDNLPGMVFDD